MADIVVVGSTNVDMVVKAARIPQPCTQGTLLIMSADCKGIVMRPGARRDGRDERG